ncbi:ymdB [Symbiodinium natans]|uniref:YmdB protein n=1 Tax=Symbiodinium natans TaxID=878477 RepID=A0A812N0C5_9DINO|nr:ymdB [Symbiodinium natans]
MAPKSAAPKAAAPKAAASKAAPKVAATKAAAAKAAPKAVAKAGRDELGVEVVKEVELPGGAKLRVSVGCIDRFEGDALVNAANQGCLGGGGVDGAITRAGGSRLHEARKALPATAGKRCATGSAVVTVGGDLKAKWCIHAVAPRYPGKDTKESKDESTLAECDALLRSAATAAMRLAKAKKAKRVAFPILAGGIFRGCRPLDVVIAQCLQGIQEGVYEGLESVYIVAFPGDPESLPILLDVAAKLEGPAEAPTPVRGEATEAIEATEATEAKVAVPVAVPELARTKSEQVVRVFREWDQDCDGRLKLEDMCTIFVNLGFTPEDAAKLFAQADVNADGLLDYAEFAQWLYDVSPAEFREQILRSHFPIASGPFGLTDETCQATFQCPGLLPFEVVAKMFMSLALQVELPSFQALFDFFCRAEGPELLSTTVQEGIPFGPRQKAVRKRAEVDFLFGLPPPLYGRGRPPRDAVSKGRSSSPGCRSDWLCNPRPLLATGERVRSGSRAQIFEEDLRDRGRSSERYEDD